MFSLTAVRSLILACAIVAFCTATERSSFAQDLPDTLQQCFTSGQCSGLQQVASFEGGEAYSYENNGNTFALFRYNIVGPSATVFDSDDGSSSTQEHLGSTWLSTATQFDAAGPVRMTLYAEQTSNAIQGDDGGPFLGNDVGLGFTVGALLAGTGTYAGEAVGPIDETSMLLDEPAFCLSDNCYLSATLNLLHMDWQQFGDTVALDLNLNDDRETLFTQFRSFTPDSPFETGFVENSSFIVGAVPEPGSSILLIGFAGAMFVKRKR